MEVWRWTTNAARPSKWAPLRDGPFLTERVCIRGRSNFSKIKNESNQENQRGEGCLWISVPDDEIGPRVCARGWR